jgi:hypothetical protein
VKHLPALQGTLTDEDRASFGARIGTQLAATADTDVKTALEHLQAAIAKAK